MHRKNLLVGLILVIGLLVPVLLITTLDSVSASSPPELQSPENKPAVPGAVNELQPVYLKSGILQPGAPDAAGLQALSGANGRVHLLVQLDFIPRQAAKDELERRGLKLLAYIPENTWIASYPAADVPSVLGLPGVVWAGALTAQNKLDPDIQAGSWAPYSLSADGATAAVSVILYPDEGLATGRSLVQAHGGKVTGQAYGIQLLMVELPPENIAALVAEEAIQWIEPAAPPLGEANDQLRSQIGVDAVNAAPYNLNGTGIDVLVYDSGQAGDHVDFGARLIHGDADSVSEHSTHVAGTVGGSGSNSAAQGGTALQWRGMAPAADLISYGTSFTAGTIIFYQDVGDIESNWAAAQNTYGADLGTASLSSNVYSNYPGNCSIMGNYGAADVLLDQIIRGGNAVVGIGDRYIATWAAGNERNQTNSCSNMYNSTSPPAAAKNPIQVGASNTNNNSMTTFSSWGPTDDGRIKPIVVAGGCQSGGDDGIKSTDNSPVNSYTVKCGTSMATPGVAGGIALMLQEYRAVYGTSGNFWPSTAKAILMQTAQDFGNPGPDYQWGFGQVDIHAAVDLILRRGFRQDSVSHGGVDVSYFVVSDSSSPAQVSLAWDDFEATFNAAVALINNLDLELVSPSGTIWRPWVLNPASPANNATRGVDNRNNQEQVQVPNPEVGTWTVRVRGTSVPQGPQTYSLACEGCKSLDVGVCASQIAGAMPLPELNPQPVGPVLNSEGDENIIAEPEAVVSQGERWQRLLEASLALQAGQPLEAPALEDAEVPHEESEAAALEPAGPAPAPSQEQQMLEAYEAARSVSPQAALEQFAALTGAARDQVMEEIHELHEQVALASSPSLDSQPADPEAELAALAEQQVADAASREAALIDYTDPAENQWDGVTSVVEPLNLEMPAVDRTVGVNCQYGTIAAAITASAPGDRLLLEGGRSFNENITIGKNLTLQGGYNGCASGLSTPTTINGGAASSVVVITSGLNVTLRNLIITNGNTNVEGGGVQFAKGGGTGTLTLDHVEVTGNTALWGGGVWVGPNADLVASYVDIHNNIANTYGGGLRLFGGRAEFTHSDIHTNTAPLGAGVYGSLQNAVPAELDLLSSADVFANNATSGSGLGGGFYMNQGSVSVADCSDIYSNQAIDGGGGYVVTTTLVIDGACSEFDSNQATGNGGGIYAQGSTILLQDQAELYNNEAGTDGSGNGGGAYLNKSTLYGYRALIWYNTTGDYGGGVFAANSSTVNLGLGSYPCAAAPCSRVTYNTATDLYGGGIYASGSTVNLNNILVANNTAGDFGGGVYAASNSYVSSYSSLYARNNAIDNIGDAIRLNSSSTLNGSGNTLAYNQAGGAADGRAIDMNVSTLDMECSVVWGHASSINLAGQDVSYSDIQGGYTGAGNLDTNPLFVNSGAQDFHLQATSPAIDRCTSGPSTDFDNDNRPVVLARAGSPYDMGADEVNGTARVGLNGSACQYGTIQQAVNAASDGATLYVSNGAYFENVNITSKSLTIQGGYDATCTTPAAGTVKVDGSLGSGSTFDILGGNVTLRNMTIEWGSTVGGGVDVDSGGHVTLDNADVINNHGTYGGGVYVGSSSVITTTNGSVLDHNTASNNGGGARVWGQFFGYQTDSDISNNCAADGGGFSVPGGDLYLNNADVVANHAVGATGQGGGIQVINNGAVTLENSVFVGETAPCCQDAVDGAGIYANNSQVSLLGSATTVMNNTASNNGGGIYLANNSQLYSTGARIGYDNGSISGNDAQNGAGMYVDSSTVDFSGTIRNNIAADKGAGIYSLASTLNLSNAWVGGSQNANQPNELGSTGHEGAGLYLGGGTQAILYNTVVASNTFQTSGYTYGGGAYITGSSALTLSQSRVERHRAPSSADGRGAAIYSLDSSVTLDNSDILTNTAGAVGGGFRLFGSSILNVLNGSSLVNNRAITGEGGAVAAGGTPDINIVNSTLQSNRTGTNGGAIALSAGTLDIGGFFDVRYNYAAGNGGALFVAGTGNADLHVTDGSQYSLLAVNGAGGNGGGIYVGNTDYVTVYAANGFPLFLNTNSAGSNGGALYANAGGFFDIYGMIQATSNTAGLNGGLVYLSGGSKVWVDDYANDRPQILVNTAQNGGAIYATGSPQVECDGVDFGGNNNGNKATSGNGGAIFLSTSSLTADNCVFHNNWATLNGGAIYASSSTISIGTDYPSPTSLDIPMEALEANRFDPSLPQATSCNPWLTQCSSFYNNNADSDANGSGNGGAIFIDATTATIDQTYLHHNSAVAGGAVFQQGAGSATQVKNTLVYSNNSSTAFGAGIRSSAGTITLNHDTLAYNTGGAGFSPGGGTSNVYNSIVWGNSQPAFGVVDDYACNIYQGGAAGIQVDPLFVSPGAGEDYRLQASSPAVDACPSGLPTDLINVIRPFNALYDMGAYEYALYVINLPAVMR